MAEPVTAAVNEEAAKRLFETWLPNYRWENASEHVRDVWREREQTSRADAQIMLTWLCPMQAAPTPVEDEVTEAMADAGTAVLTDVKLWQVGQGKLARQVYAAMRAARKPAPTPEPSEDWRACYEAEHARAERLAAQTSEELAAQPSEKLRLLRELRQAVLEVQRKTHVHYSEVDKVLYALAALDALHPGDTEEK